MLKFPMIRSSIVLCFLSSFTSNCGSQYQNSEVHEVETFDESISYISFNEPTILARQTLVLDTLCEFAPAQKIAFGSIEGRSPSLFHLSDIKVDGCEASSGFLVFGRPDIRFEDIDGDGENEVVSPLPEGDMSQATLIFKGKTIPLKNGSPDLDLDSQAETGSFPFQYRLEEPTQIDSTVGDTDGRQPSGRIYPSDYDPNYAAIIASRAKSQSLGRSRGQCWKYVNDAVMRRGGIRMGMSASIFNRTVSRANKRRQFGLCPLNSRQISKAPIGSVLGYNPSYQGFHSRWGHGEVLVNDTNYVCSDFCTTRRPNFTASFILYPCKKY